jgi:hypothetical protein
VTCRVESHLGHTRAEVAVKPSPDLWPSIGTCRHVDVRTNDFPNLGLGVRNTGCYRRSNGRDMPTSWAFLTN